jgi:Cytochrome C oxidase subunit II, transmembrane domain
VVVSTPMEGILLVFNKHIIFILCVLVPFGIWSLVVAVCYFVEFRNRKNFKFVHSKELEILWSKRYAWRLATQMKGSGTLDAAGVREIYCLITEFQRKGFLGVLGIPKR